MLALVLLFITSACKNNPTANRKLNDVTIQIASDPGSLNPLCNQGNAAAVVVGQVMQTLTSFDFKTTKIVPVMVKERAKIEAINDGPYKGGASIAFELRDDIKWDNGSPVTVSDVLFSLKAIKNPIVNDLDVKQIVDDIDSVSYDDIHGRKFVLYCKSRGIRTEVNCGSIPVLPEYFYDSAGFMKKFSVHSMSAIQAIDKKKLDKNIIEFANAFNAEKFTGINLCGSGPYHIKEYAKGQRVVLEKKKTWWGNNHMTENTALEAYPDHLIYKVINDPAAVLTELKAGKIDALSQIPSKDFVAMKADTHFTAKFNLYNPSDYSWCAIALNEKNPILKDINVRRALAHLIDIDNIIKTVLYGYGEPINSMEHPLKKEEYNSDIKKLAFDPAEARAMLEKSGWKDLNGDGILEKNINGRNTPLHLSLLTNKGNLQREGIAKILKEEGRKIGMDIEIKVIDINLMTKSEKSHDFEMAFITWQSLPIPTDPKPTWHTESSEPGGNNFTFFGNAHTDALIDSIRSEVDDKKRIPMFKKFQAMVYDDMPYLFLYAYKGKVAISKRFENAYASPIRPGYNEAGFRISGQ